MTSTTRGLRRAYGLGPAVTPAQAPTPQYEATEQARAAFRRACTAFANLEAGEDALLDAARQLRDAQQAWTHPRPGFTWSAPAPGFSFVTVTRQP